VDPFTIALLGGSMLANVGGGMISRNDALSNAQHEAQAQNAILAGGIQKMGGDYNTYNKPAFDTLISSYAPTAQAANLNGAQSARANRNTSSVVADDPSSIPLGNNAPPAVTNAFKTLARGFTLIV
jgi:hypothetical protein